MKLNEWFSKLSINQRIWFFGTLLAGFLIIITGIYFNPGGKKVFNEIITPDMTISQIALKLGVTGKSLAKELKLPIDVAKKKSIKSLNVDETTLHHAVEHLLSHRDTNLKYFIYFVLSMIAFVFLVKVGRPQNSDIKQRTEWYPRIIYIAMLIISVIACGFLFGKSPNPMEGAVKVFKSAVGLYPDPVIKLLAFIFFILLAVIGNKIICGWACPFGSLQELIYMLPVLRKIKRKKLPFWITNTIRATLFLFVLFILFGMVGGKKGLVLYHYINPFNLFNLDFDSISIPITISLVVIISLIFYRPFCQLICPFGFISWVFEKISIFRIRINHEKCTNCGACIKACPLHAAKGYVEKKRLASDCFSCSRCLTTCSFDAISYGIKQK